MAASKNKGFFSGAKPQAAASSKAKGFFSGGSSGSATASSGGGDKSLVGVAKGAVGKVLGSTPIRTALETIDLPRSVVASAVKEGLDADTGNGASLKDFVDQIKHHIGVGQILQEYAPNANINLKRALGFAGDVAVDPLTYLTFGASAAGAPVEEGAKALAEEGAREGTRLTSKEVADKALDLGKGDTANKVLKGRSAALLSDADKAELGISTTPRFGLGAHKVDVPFLEQISKLRARATEFASPILTDNKVATAIRKATDPFASALVDLRKRDPGAARQVERSARVSTAVGAGVTHKAITDLGALHTLFEGADKDTVRQLIEDGTARAAHAGIEGDAARGLADWFEAVRTNAEKESGRNIPKLEDYLPHQMTQDFKAVLEDSGKRADSTGAKQAFEKRRTNRVGQKWFGVKLETGSIDEMEGIAKDALGDNYVQVFKDDPWAIADSYAHGVGKMVADHRFQGELEDRGLLKHFDLKQLKKSERNYKTFGKTAAKNEKLAAKFGPKAEDAAARAGELTSAVGDVTDEVGAGFDRATAHGDAAAAIDTDALAAQHTDLANQLATSTAPPEPNISKLKAAVAKVSDAGTAEAGSADEAKLVAKLAAQDEKIAAKTSEIAELTKAAHAKSLAADADVAALKRQLDVSKIGFSKEAAASALEDAGHGDLASTLRDASRTDTRTVVGQIRQEVDARAEAGEVAKNDKFKRTIKVEDVGGKIEGDPETLTKVAKAEEALRRMHAARDAASQSLQDLRDAAGGGDVSGAVAKANAAAVSAKQNFDQASLAYSDWQSHVENLNTQMADVQQKLAEAGPAKRAALREEAAGLADAQYFADEAAKQTEPALAEVAKLESVAAAAGAKAQTALDTADKARSVMAEMNTPERRNEFERMVNSGFSEQLKTDPTRWADPDLAKAVAEMAMKGQGDDVGKFLKTYDTLLNRWKGYSLVSPGFHGRNWMGAQWNNWMADVDISTQVKNVRALHWYKRGGVEAVAEHLGDEWGKIYEEAERLNVWNRHDIPDLGDLSPNGRNSGVVGGIAKWRGADPELVDKVNKLDPTSMNNAILSTNYKAAEKVERMVRSELFVDRMLKGFSAEDAHEAVIKYHFDYQEMSQFERKVVKRVIPFYTWTRKNLPLQVENFMKDPQKFNRFLALKRNVELGTSPDAVVPDYFHDLMGMKTPWSTSGKGFFGGSEQDPIYMTLDLPINRIPGLGEPFSDTFWNGLSPVFKLPIELKTNKSLFTGNPLQSPGEGPTPIPNTWLPLAPILQQLDGLGGLPKVERQGGQYVMDRRDAYKVESALPLLGRLRRLLPSEQKYQDRALTSWLSIFAGVNGRTLTSSEIKSEMARRTAK